MPVGATDFPTSAQTLLAYPSGFAFGSTRPTMMDNPFDQLMHQGVELAPVGTHVRIVIAKLVE